MQKKSAVNEVKSTSSSLLVESLATSLARSGTGLMCAYPSVNSLEKLTLGLDCKHQPTSSPDILLPRPRFRSITLKETKIVGQKGSEAQNLDLRTFQA